MKDALWIVLGVVFATIWLIGQGPLNEVLGSDFENYVYFAFAPLILGFAAAAVLIFIAKKLNINI